MHYLGEIARAEICPPDAVFKGFERIRSPTLQEFQAPPGPLKYDTRDPPMELRMVRSHLAKRTHFVLFPPGYE